jgi:hypothetical protein
MSRKGEMRDCTLGPIISFGLILRLSPGWPAGQGQKMMEANTNNRRDQIARGGERDATGQAGGGAIRVIEARG